MNIKDVHIGDIVEFDPVSVDDPEYWDDYLRWEEDLIARVEEVETNGHPFLWVKIRSLRNKKLVDWVDSSWIEKYSKINKGKNKKY